MKVVKIYASVIGCMLFCCKSNKIYREGFYSDIPKIIISSWKTQKEYELSYDDAKIVEDIISRGKITIPYPGSPHPELNYEINIIDTSQDKTIIYFLKNLTPINFSAILQDDIIQLKEIVSKYTTFVK